MKLEGSELCACNLLTPFIPQHICRYLISRIVTLKNDYLNTFSVCFDLPLKILPNVNVSIHLFEFFHNFLSNIGYYGIFISFVILLGNFIIFFNFYIPLKSTKSHRFSDNLRGMEVNWIAEIFLILEVNFRDEPLSKFMKISYLHSRRRWPSETGFRYCCISRNMRLM